MFENRSLKLDLFALALCGLAVFLGASLGTYNSADPVPALTAPLDKFYQADQLVYPATETVTNACGKWGALASDLLLNGLGVGAYYVVLSLIIVDVLLLTRRRIDTPVLRMVGWVTSLAGLTAIISLLAPNASLGPMIGAGGYLGVLGRTLLETHFALAGSLILAASLLIGGLMLCTDYALFRMAFTASTMTAAAAAKGRQRVADRRQSLAERNPKKRAKAELVSVESDVEDAAEEIEELAVKVRGKSVQDDLEEEGLEEEELLEDELDEDIEDEEEAEEPDSEVVVKKRERPKKPAGVASRPHFSMKSGFDKEAREQVMTTLDAAANQEEPGEYELPDIDLLIEGDDMCLDEQVKEVRRKAKILEKTFGNFGFNVKVVEIETGPVIAQYEVELEAGLRLAKITNLADDLAIALRVPSVRIVAPIPGKNTVGIEVPNEVRQVVRLREVIEETNGKTKKMKIPLFLGKDVSGNPLTVDLATLPHLLIAGRTGTGKSVCLNAIISSILMTKRPDEVRMLMIDPKMVELSGYARLPHLMHPVVTDMRKAEAILAWAVDKMEERYAMLARAGVRHVSSYNQLTEEELRRRMKPEGEEEWAAIPTHLPFIVIVADEMADLMMTSGKEVEQHIIRLAQKSRAVGIHLILATQKPTVDVITGLIKSNLPARISFQVASRTDSRVVLDEMGADKLLGNGDMLFLWPGTSSLLRGQGTYLTDEEIESVVDCVSTGEQHFVNELVNLKVDEGDGEAPGPLKKRDDLYEAAVDVVVREGRGSVSLLQRTLGIGYGRAARLIDYMAEDGIVGAYAGSQAREVIISLSDWEAMQNGGEVTSEPPRSPGKAIAEPKRRSNKVKPEPEGEDEEQEASSQVEWDDGFEEQADEEDWDEQEQEEYEAESA
ncbi:MAG: DNA translocase FtsK 4TM domain-containing protein [Planctomycetes bacterium]|nr:DNA translocase FtsK 4TM domain-containing protein [Planctomycetota bacterium]